MGSLNKSAPTEQAAGGEELISGAISPRKANGERDADHFDQMLKRALPSAHISLDGQQIEFFGRSKDIKFTKAELVEVLPVYADSAIENGPAVKRKMAIVSRGRNSIKEKVGRLVKAGAIGIIVINNDQQDEDACAEVDGQFGQHVAIPVIGVSYKSGERMRQTDDIIKVLVAETMAGKENECLDLSGERLCEDEVKKLSHKAGELHHVKEANFSDCNIFQWQWDCAGPGLLTAFFQELTHLQFLDLSGNILVNTDDEQQLALVIPELKQLKTLNISRASISAAELDEISCALGEHGGLTSLDVSANPFFDNDDASGPPASTYFSMKNSANELKDFCDEAGLSKAGSKQAMVDRLTQHQSQGSGGVVALGSGGAALDNLVKALQQNPDLTQLNLSTLVYRLVKTGESKGQVIAGEYIDGGSSSGAAFATGIKPLLESRTNLSLTDLDISNCNLLNAGATIVADGLKGNKGLKKIDLSGNVMAVDSNNGNVKGCNVISAPTGALTKMDGFIDICAAIESHPALTTVSLARNWLGGLKNKEGQSSAKALTLPQRFEGAAPAMKKMMLLKTLISLDVADNNFSSETAVALLEAATAEEFKQTGARPNFSLDLSANGLERTDECLHALITLLMTKNFIKAVDMSGNSGVLAEISSQLCAANVSQNQTE